MTIKELFIHFLNGLKLITVEPAMVLYMMAFMTTSVVEQAFFVNKACRVNHNFNKTICDHIEAPENSKFLAEVQVRLINFALLEILKLIICR